MTRPRGAVDAPAPEGRRLFIERRVGRLVDGLRRVMKDASPQSERSGFVVAQKALVALQLERVGERAHAHELLAPVRLRPGGWPR